jgi:hypothetical protein
LKIRSLALRIEVRIQLPLLGNILTLTMSYSDKKTLTLCHRETKILRIGISALIKLGCKGVDLYNVGQTSPVDEEKTRINRNRFPNSSFYCLVGTIYTV